MGKGPFDELKTLNEEKKLGTIADEFKAKFSEETFKGVPEKVLKKFIAKTEEEIDSATYEAFELYNEFTSIKTENDEATGRINLIFLPCPQILASPRQRVI